jgi:hypothetical protein
MLSFMAAGVKKIDHYYYQWYYALMQSFMAAGVETPL